MSSIKVIKLVNSNGMELLISNLGATIIALNVPNKTNELVNVVVGMSPEEYMSNAYLSNCSYLGASIGRYAGRLSTGKFDLNENSYPIYNTNGVHLHGGEAGFDKKFWTVNELSESSNPFVIFSFKSKHLEEGYPGNLDVSVTYQLTESNDVKITYKAITDAATPVNLTNHSYFNLNGSGSILDHELKLNSEQTLEVDAKLIPSGKIMNSKNTRFDFTEKEVIGRDDFIGFDDTFILGNDDVKAVLHSPKTGIKMKVLTNQPASVIFTPPQLADFPYLNGVKYTKFSAICFETQNYPDAPNNPHFPSSILNPGEEYVNESVFEFSIC